MQTDYSKNRPNMEYVKLGNSNLRVSRICLGCMGFGDASIGQHSWTISEEPVWVSAAKGTNSIFIQIPYQFKNNGTTPLIVSKIPDALSQNGIHHRSDFVLSAPDGIKVSHRSLVNL